MAISLPYDKFVNAKAYECWSLSLFGKPKLTVICGDCSSQFSTREWRTMTAPEKGRVVACCPVCGKWNKTKLVYE